MESQRTQKVLLGILILAALGYFGHEYLYRPRAEVLDGLERRLQLLEAQNRAAERLAESQGSEEAQQELALRQEQLLQLETLVPSAEEVPELLDAISAEAQRTGVEVILIQPMGTTEEEFYARKRYDLAALGSYHQIGDFLTRVGSLPRIITPRALALVVQEEETRTGDPRLEARFSIETYVLPPIPHGEMIHED